MARFFVLFLVTVSALFSEGNVTEYKNMGGYIGIGMKTFQLGKQTQNGITQAVNADAFMLNVGTFIPSNSLKIELSASFLGYTEYKEFNATTGKAYAFNPDKVVINEYTINVSYGGKQRNDRLFAFPFVYTGAGVKIIHNNRTDNTTINSFALPLLEAGVGYSIRNNSIEFFAKYGYDYLFNVQDFTTESGDVINMNAFNGTFEVGFNYLF